MPNTANMHECFTKAARGNALIFDLDGTLIDSREAILKCWTGALQAMGLCSQVALDESLIGPPARHVAHLIAGEGQTQTAEKLCEQFIHAYDDWGWQLCKPYVCVDGALRKLSSMGTPLYLVTNKRAKPTHSILSALGWRPLFLSVDSPDNESANFRTKQTMLADLISQASIQPEQATYVGDTPQDQIAANLNSLGFIAAWWGDAAKHFPQPWIKAA
jgi:phosphoglycolate phosphatase-like HAD superfamily hydrolase